MIGAGPSAKTAMQEDNGPGCVLLKYASKSLGEGGGGVSVYSSPVVVWYLRVKLLNLHVLWCYYGNLFKALSGANIISGLICVTDQARINNN